MLKKLSLAVVVTTLGTGSAWAGQVYVERATGSGVADSDLQTATELVKSSVQDVSSNTVIDDEAKADIVLEPHLVRLGSAYVLSLTELKNGQNVSSSQLKAANIEELDKVAERLTRSVLTGEKASSHPRVGEITNEEAREGTQRRPVRKAAYLGFGGASLQHLNTTGLGVSLAAAYTWDVNVARIKILGEGDINGGAFFANGALGGNYYLSTEDVAPYVMADFGGGVAKMDQGIFSGQTVAGFVVGVGAGVELMRTSSVNLDLSARAAFLLHDNFMGLPEALTLRLGLYF